MQIQTIIGENGKMPKLCNQGACASAILTDGDDIYVQGYLPAEVEQRILVAPLGEGFVRMPRAVFEKIARQVLSS